MRWPSHAEESPGWVEGDDSLEWIYDNVPAYEKGLEKTFFSQCIQSNLLKNEPKTADNALEMPSLRGKSFFSFNFHKNSVLARVVSSRNKSFDTSQQSAGTRPDFFFILASNE